jgi:hypothetical protein
MTRKDYELLARVFASTNPYRRDSVWSDRDVEDRRVAYAQWERTVRSLCDALEADNPRFDRSRFQYAATAPR